MNGATLTGDVSGGIVEELGFLISASANSNTVIGYNAGTNLTQGDSNVLLGNTAGEAIVTGSENICVGFAANVASADNTNNIVIGDMIEF